MNNYAYITLATHETYLKTASYLQASLRRVQSKYKLIVMITSNLKNHKLLSYFDNYIIVPHLTLNNTIHKDTINKFHCFNQTSYNKLFYLDADLVVLQNLDILLEQSENYEYLYSFYYGNKYQQDNNLKLFPYGGFFIYKPNKSIYKTVINNYSKLIQYDDELIFTNLLYKEYFLENKPLDKYCNLFSILPCANQFSALLFHTYSRPNKYFYQNHEISLQEFELLNDKELILYLEKCLGYKKNDKNFIKWCLYLE